jgi:hypothetical protein
MLTSQMMRAIVNPRQYALVSPRARLVRRARRGAGRRGMGRRGGLARPPPVLHALARLRRTPRRRAPPWLTPVRLARVRRAPGQIWIYAWPYPVHQTAGSKLMRALLRANDPSVNAEWLD